MVEGESWAERSPCAMARRRPVSRPPPSIVPPASGGAATNPENRSAHPLHPGHQMPRSTLLPLLLLACSNATPPERYGFVATLGNDTVAVERIARSPTRLVTDGVDRWPFVRRRHTEFDLAPDGTIRHMVMDVRTPNGRTPRERGRRVTADFSKHAVTVSVRDSGGVRDTSFATGGAITVPHVSMMYSVIELEIAAALRRAAATRLQPGDSV